MYTQLQIDKMNYVYQMARRVYDRISKGVMDDDRTLANEASNIMEATRKTFHDIAFGSCPWCGFRGFLYYPYEGYSFHCGACDHSFVYHPGDNVYEGTDLGGSSSVIRIGIDEHPLNFSHGRRQVIDVGRRSKWITNIEGTYNLTHGVVEDVVMNLKNGEATRISGVIPYTVYYDFANSNRVGEFFHRIINKRTSRWIEIKTRIDNETDGGGW